MAGKSTERQKIQELIRISEESRDQLGDKIVGVRRTLGKPARVLGVMRNSPAAWLIGSVGAGIIGSAFLGKLTSRKKKSSFFKKKALGLTLTAARALAKVWLSKQIKSLGSKWIEDRVKRTTSPFQTEPEPAIKKNPYSTAKHARTSGP